MSVINVSRGTNFVFFRPVFHVEHKVLKKYKKIFSRHFNFFNTKNTHICEKMCNFAPAK